MNESSADALKRSVTEPEAFAAFYRNHVGRLFSYIAGRVFDGDVAMDLTAETFAQAYLSRAKFRGETDGQALAWLYRIAGGQISRYFRKRSVERKGIERLGIEPPQLEPDEQRRLEDLSASAELRAAVRNEMARLSTRQRQALTLRVVEERPYAEVASSLGISEEAARARVMRALKALTRRLKYPLQPEGDSI